MRIAKPTDINALELLAVELQLASAVSVARPENATGDRAPCRRWTFGFVEAVKDYGRCWPPTRSPVVPSL